MKAYTAYLRPLIVVLLLNGCASLPTDYPRRYGAALEDTDDTMLGRNARALIASHPGKSGFYLLDKGLDAFAARLRLMDAAERSIDVQYYFIVDDTTGRLFVERLLAAADRGVRIRLLLDDYKTKGHDPGLAALHSHPRIEVRVFNPFALRRTRSIEFLTDFNRVNRRMHNKSFTVDNQVTIVGGRNIGDEYFDARSDLIFGDFDLIAVGPVVQEVSRAFDAYWNSDPAVPIAALASNRTPALKLAEVRRDLSEHRDAKRDSSYARAVRSTQLERELRAGQLPFRWGNAHLAYDLPEKVVSSPDDRSGHLGPDLRAVVENARSEVVVITPYFVPQEPGVALFASLRARGVRVIILTNSLASTDVPMVHSGYARYREPLLKVGAELYELKPDAAVSARDNREGQGASVSSLHAKAFVIDRERLFVGSFNLDPRSIWINTEMGILADNRDLANGVAQFVMERLPENTYRLQLRGVVEPIPQHYAGRKAVGELEWIAREGEREVRYRNEPAAGFWRRLSVGLFSLLPIEDQL